MCGICGVIGIETGQDIVRRMAQAMIHRGPDSAGFLDDGVFHLGMRRLSIIDLATGDQPIYNEDHTVAIVLNGEIYNFRDLYHQLMDKGHQFCTRSDTEAIIHAYEEWGTGCTAHLRGMFAFAIFDRRTKAENGASLFLARDRMGIKPLYLWQTEGRLAFASEVRTLLASGQVPRQLSAAGLYTYLLFGSVQEPLTLVEGIVSLPPASWLQATYTPRGLLVQRGQYWLPPRTDPTEPSSEQVQDWLAESVQSHLVSDVPLGAFLSGGLDSGTIVALGSQALPNPLETFTLAFDNWPADERDMAQITADRWKTSHHTRVVSQQEILLDLPQALASMDQPTVDGVNSWYVSREAKRVGLTVALSGVGGDELFAGYPAFRQVPPLQHLPHSISCLRQLPGWTDGWPRLPGNRDLRRKLMAYVSGDMPLDHPYFSVRGLFTGLRAQRLLSPDVLQELLAEDKTLLSWRAAVQSEIVSAGQYDRVGEVSWLELSQYMRSTLLRDTDMMSMAHSLEVRVPFVDHILVERLLPVKGRLKLASGRSKPLLADAMVGLLPSEITRLAKRTFTLPFEIWLRQELAPQVKTTLMGEEPDMDGWLNLAMTRKIWLSFECGETNWARPWALYVLVDWVRRNF